MSVQEQTRTRVIKTEYHQWWVNTWPKRKSSPWSSIHEKVYPQSGTSGQTMRQVRPDRRHAMDTSFVGAISGQRSSPREVSINSGKSRSDAASERARLRDLTSGHPAPIAARRGYTRMSHLAISPDACSRRGQQPEMASSQPTSLRYQQRHRSLRVTGRNTRGRGGQRSRSGIIPDYLGAKIGPGQSIACKHRLRRKPSAQGYT